MQNSLLLKIIIGVAILALSEIYQFHNLNQRVPSLSEFSQTKAISGAYSLSHGGKTTWTSVGGREFYCGVGADGPHGSCSGEVNMPNGSVITVEAATINTDAGNVLYASEIKFGSNEIYSQSPEKSLQGWWSKSFLGTLTPLLWLMGGYYAVLTFLSVRKERAERGE
jgi:hypothetical protein